MIRAFKWRVINKLKKETLTNPTARRELISLIKEMAYTGKLTNLCMEEGVLPVPVHFNSPIPDVADLESRQVWDKRSKLKGIDFREDAQIEFLNLLGSDFGQECNWPITQTDNPTDFYVENASFSYGCAAATHCMIRHFKPGKVIEIGSGMSSLVISKAVEMNKTMSGVQGKHIMVDPYPQDFVKSLSTQGAELTVSRVEMLDPEFFDQLRENDILFIDSSHSVRIGGDVNFLYLDILPRLAPGVVVHIHDINLPYEYPKVYATSETFRQFWTEQYLLQSFLCFNDRYEVMLALNYIMTDHLDSFKKAFPFYNPDLHRFSSSSFWIRHKVMR